MCPCKQVQVHCCPFLQVPSGEEGPGAGGLCPAISTSAISPNPQSSVLHTRSLETASASGNRCLSPVTPLAAPCWGPSRCPQDSCSISSHLTEDEQGGDGGCHWSVLLQGLGSVTCAYLSVLTYSASPSACASPTGDTALRGPWCQGVNAEWFGKQSPRWGIPRLALGFASVAANEVTWGGPQSTT